MINYKDIESFLKKTYIYCTTTSQDKPAFKICFHTSFICHDFILFVTGHKCHILSSTNLHDVITSL